MKKIMKKIKGFTLIELIAVVILLGIIGLITYPTVTGVINDSKEKAYNTQISMVEEAGKRWGIDNTDKLSENKNVLLQIDDLIKNGYINKTKNGELIDPRTNEKLEGCIIISYSSSYKQYEYKYDTECTPVEDTTPPSIAMNVANGVVNSNGWATSKFYVNVNGDHLTSYKYCVSNVECEPNTVVTGNSGSIYIQTAGINYVCIKGINTVGSTETTCQRYGLDEGPLNFVVVSNNGEEGEMDDTRTIVLDILPPSANSSGFDHYEYCYKVKDSSNSCNFVSTTNPHITINNMSTEVAYEFTVKVYDNVGRVDTKTFTVQLEWVCFVAGTKVYTEEGFRNIEDINIGDKVWTINLDTNEAALNAVSATIISTTDELYHITVNGEIVSASPRHQFYVQDKGWVRARNLEVGDIVVSDKGYYEIVDIEYEKLETPINVYNLSVENTHNYLVTNNLILVHNVAVPSPGRDDGFEYSSLPDPNLSSSPETYTLTSRDGNETMTYIKIQDVDNPGSYKYVPENQVHR